MSITLTSGNLLEQAGNSEAVVNTVNTVGVMGKGIALQFKNAYPENFQAYKRACAQKQVKIGKMFVFETGMLINPRIIINFPTKKHWRGKSHLEDIKLGLTDLVETIRRHHIKSIAMPPLGCGLGGLNWNVVRPLIEHAMQSVPNLDVFLFEPIGAPDPKDMPNRTKKSKMTPTTAKVIGLIQSYLASGLDYTCSLLEIQKLAYFLEEAGEEMRLNFEKGKFGPYSDPLRNVLLRMDGTYITGLGDGRNTPDVIIELTANSVEKAREFLHGEHSTISHMKRVQKLINSFETPFGMELLASVHWSHKQLGANSYEDATECIHKWNTRKKTIFKKQHIKIAWQRLIDQEWIPN